MKKHYLVQATVVIKRGDNQLEHQEITFVVPTRSFRFRNPEHLEQILREATTRMIVHRQRYSENDGKTADEYISAPDNIAISSFSYGKIGEYDAHVPLEDLTASPERPSWITPHEIEYENKVANIAQLMLDNPHYRSTTDTLSCAVEKGPLFDGDVPSKSSRDMLMDLGLMCKVVEKGEDGQNAATHLGRDVYRRVWGNADTLREAMENRRMMRVCRDIELLRCDQDITMPIGDREVVIRYPREVVQAAIDRIKGPVRGGYITEYLQYEAIRGNTHVPLETLSHEFLGLYITDDGVLKANLVVTNYCRGSDLRKQLLKDSDAVKFVPRAVIDPVWATGDKPHVVRQYTLISIEAIKRGMFRTPDNMFVDGIAS